MTARIGHPERNSRDKTYRKNSQEHENMDRTAGTQKVGDKSADTGSRDRTGGTGQPERTVETGQLCQDSRGREDATRLLEKTEQGSWDRTTKTWQPWQDSQDKAPGTRDSWDKMTNTSKMWQDSYDRKARTGNVGQHSQGRSVW
jgi:hypothetical protein